MKKILVLFLALLVSFVGCNGETPGERTPHAPAPYEEIEPLEDFKCYFTGGNTAKTVLHDEAKDLYRMIIDSDLLDEEEETDKVSDHYTLVFYNSEETYPEATVPEEHFYGVYRIYESGLVRYTASPDSTFLFRYMTPADLYNEIYFYLNA